MYAAPQAQAPDFKAWVSSWWRNFPLCCRGICALCLAIYILQVVGVVNVYFWCFDVSDIVEEYQVYRVFTGPLLHGNLLHILFNLLAFASIAPPIERHCGTSVFGALTLCFMAVSGAMGVSLVCLMRFLTLQAAIYAKPMIPFMETVAQLFPYNACNIGISGLLFAYLTMQTLLDGPSVPRSFCGLFTIPSGAYPWIMLLLIQLMWPGVAFPGHLCGILVGYTGCWLDRYLQRLRLDNCVPAAVKSSQPYATPGAVPSFVGPPFGTMQTGYRGPYGATQVPAQAAAPPPRFPGQGRTIGNNFASGRAGPNMV